MPCLGANMKRGSLRALPKARSHPYGEKLFHQYGCANCHHFDQQGRAPSARLVRAVVEIQGGETVRADEAYIRESILYPSAKIVYGYQNIMPTFASLLNEEQVIQLIQYIKAIGPGSGTEEPSSSGSLPKGAGADPAIGEAGTTGNATSPVRNR